MEKESNNNKEELNKSNNSENQEEEQEENQTKFSSFKKSSINVYSKLTSICSVSNFNFISIGDISGKISLYDNRINKVSKLFLSENKEEIK